jgi:hypothetical protein
VSEATGIAGNAATAIVRQRFDVTRKRLSSIGRKFSNDFSRVRAHAHTTARSIPDGPDCQWKGGDYERIEAKDRALLKAAKEAEIEASGYFTDPEWREVISPDGVICSVTRFRDAELRTSPPPIPDDLSIPDFLLRQQEPLAMAAQLRVGIHTREYLEYPHECPHFLRVYYQSTILYCV